MTKAIIFDMWGTLVDQGTFSPLRQTYNLLRPRMHFSEFVVRFERVFMTHSFSGLNEAFEVVYNEFRLRPPSFVLEKLIGVWNKNKLFARPYDDTMAYVASLKDRGIKVALITNSDCFSLEVVDKFKLRDLFDGVYLSCETGLLKNDPALAEKVLADLECAPDELIVVGDSVETDMALAEAIGAKGVLIDRKNKREYPGKILTLTELDAYITPNEESKEKKATKGKKENTTEDAGEETNNDVSENKEKKTKKPAAKKRAKKE